jgi:thymidylate kinase
MSLTQPQAAFAGSPPAHSCEKNPRFIAVLGPDGSGKSELTQSLTRLLERSGGQVSNFHWRPQDPKLPGPAVVVTSPHAQKKSSLLRSIVKLLYLVWEFNVGFHFKLRPLLRSQHYVIFDRYYHDMLADPLRYRYNGPMVLARWAARLVPQPDIWIILDAPIEVLRSRKQEVSEQETERQRLEYLLLAQRLPNSHVLDSMRPPEELAQEIAAFLA